MRRTLFGLVLFAQLTAVSIVTAQGLTPKGALRVAYLSTNPAQAVTDPATGTLRGTAIEMAQELARRLRVDAVELIPLGSPQNVIDAIRDGRADIGFVAYNPERA